MFFDSWQSLGRIAVVGVSAYAALLLLLRVSGKRTLSKMNAFDFVVTVALGSTLATILLSKDTALAEGMLALGLLIFLQFIITWLSVRSKAVSHLIKAEPKLLFHRGEFLQKAMKAERVNEEEILQAMRSQGFGELEEAEAVVLETDGSLSIIRKSSDGRASVLSNVTRFNKLST
ncbi:MAG: YetF domain-containing protein [Gammaproteobacteria bacterium]|jgi:uncharacterized membrane protein YcaP (DUF421 family)